MSNRVCIEYPMFGNIISLITELKNIIKNKDLESLDRWIDIAISFGINEINSFINGIKRDVDAARNAITYDYSNGLAEGSVNKLKVIKRIMYGRCTFELLRKKVLRLELNR